MIANCLNNPGIVKRVTNRIFLALLMAGALAMAPSHAIAQQPARIAPAKPTASQPSSGAATARTHPNDPMLWDTEQMMDEAVAQISKRYNLTPQQQEYTQLLLKKRVREFLDQYETDVRELLQESIDMRLGKKESDPAAMMKWAIRAMPVYDAAKNAILDGNREWGQILDENQKKTHDRDLSLMDQNFTNVTKQLKDMEDGKGPKFNRTPSMNDGGVTPTGQNVARRPEIEDSWIAYVEKFINTYKLDDAKKIAAREKIHKDQLEKAKQYREANKDKFRQIEDETAKNLRELPVEERMKRIGEADRKKKELESPIRRLFIELCRRLDALPSSKQRAEVTDAAKKDLDDLYHRLAGDTTKKSMSQRESADRPAQGDEKKPAEPTSAPSTAEESPKPADAPQASDAPKPGESAPASDKPATL